MLSVSDVTRRVVSGWLLMGVLMLAGVARAAEGQPGFSVPAGKALVYVIQTETRNFSSVAVYVDGRSIGNVKANSYLAFAADPGEHRVSSAAIGTAAIMVTVESGKTYYVSTRINPVGTPEFRMLSDVEARPLLSSYASMRDEVVMAGPGSIQPQASTGVIPAGSAYESRRSSDDHWAVILKAGSFKLSTANQQWLGVASTVTTKSSGVWGAEAEYQYYNGFALGLEFVGFKNSWTQTNGAQGSLTTTVFMVNGKKYFPIGEMFRPYVGIGVGSAATSFSGDITGNTSGFSSQLIGGAELRFGKVGLYLEGKALSAKTKDSNSETVDVSGKGVFAGVSVHF